MPLVHVYVVHVYGTVGDTCYVQHKVTQNEANTEEAGPSQLSLHAPRG